MYITLVGNKKDSYINPYNGEAYINEHKATNYNKIDMQGVNTLVIYMEADGTYWITQANGFTEERGLFIQIYDREGNKV